MWPTLPAYVFSEDSPCFFETPWLYLQIPRQVSLNVFSLSLLCSCLFSIKSCHFSISVELLSLNSRLMYAEASPAFYSLAMVTWTVGVWGRNVHSTYMHIPVKPIFRRDVLLVLRVIDKFSAIKRFGHRL